MNITDQNQEGRAASLPRKGVSSADESREGNSRLPSRNGKKSTPHKPSHELTERWFLVDAKDQILGRVAVGIAKLLMGKDEPSFNKAVDSKTNVVVINADKIKLSGNKLADKLYHTHSGYLGSLKTKSASQIIEGKQSERVLEKAVYGMLPKNKLRHVMMERLRLFTTETHTHGGQNPTPVSF